MTRPGWEAWIGLEVHAQLRTASKAFSAAPTGVGAPPNRLVDGVTTAQPGSMPVLNAHAVELAVRAGLALGSTIEPWSRFDRKHYAYADLPKGYQITQQAYPLCRNGELVAPLSEASVRCRIERIHLEEDSGKSVHGGPDGGSLIDLNRAGTPLIEVVTHPDLRTPEEASAWFSALRQVLMAVGAVTGDLQDGSLRADLNVSVRRVDEPPGQRTETKNVNSFKAVRDAIAFEIERQVAALESGEGVFAETRLWDEARRRTVLMRRKEGPADYRFMPEPDLPPLALSPAWIAEVGANLPELPAQTRERLQRTLGLSAADAALLVANDGWVRLLEDALPTGAGAQGVVHWIVGPVAAALNSGVLTLRDGRLWVGAVGIGGEALGELQGLVESGVLSPTLAKTVWEAMVQGGGRPGAIVESKGLRRTDDAAALAGWVDGVLEAHAAEVALYRSGKVQVLGFLMGQVMKASGARADATQVKTLLKARLGPAEES